MRHHMQALMAILLGLAALLGIPSRCHAEDKPKAMPFVRVSLRDARYLELSNGHPALVPR